MAPSLRPRKRIKASHTELETKPAKLEEPTTTLEPQTVNFLDIPAEIRIMIYDEAATQHKSEIKLGRRQPESKSRARGHHDCFSLLQTCSQFRTEFKAIYYQQVTFAVPRDDVRLFAIDINALDVKLSRLVVLMPKTKTSDSGNARIRDLNPDDYLPVLELKFKYPQLCGEITPGFWDATNRKATLPDITKRVFGVLQTDANSKWKATVTSPKVLSQVLISEPFGNISKVRIIYRAHHDEPWMRKALGDTVEAEKWGLSLGFDVEKIGVIPDFIALSFGVYYW